jgi:hypothetical protein
MATSESKSQIPVFFIKDNITVKNGVVHEKNENKVDRELKKYYINRMVKPIGWSNG